jgi:hypothetical protein
MDKTVWIVRWRGCEEERAGRQDAMDRWGQLDGRGIESEVLEVAEDGQERSNTPTDGLSSAITAGDALDRRQDKPLGAPRARARLQTTARGK